METIIKKILKEETEKRLITEVTTEVMSGLLLKAVDSLKDSLRYIESALQFAYQSNNEDLIRELEDIRTHISYDEDQIGWEGNYSHESIIGRIKAVIEKYS